MTTHQRNFPSIDPAKLERLAETAVKVGLRLQPGQDLFLTAPVAALPLARAIVTEAYKAGAGLVTPILADEEMTLARFRFIEVELIAIRNEQIVAHHRDNGTFTQTESTDP